MATIYDPIVFVNDSAPPINASALNYIQAGMAAINSDVVDQEGLLASTIAFATTVAGNLGAQASSLAAQASSIYGVEAQASSLAAADVALASAFAQTTGAVGSSNAALATALPQIQALASAAGPQASAVIAHGSQLAQHTSQIASQATGLAAVTATAVALASSLDEVAPQLAILDGVASTLSAFGTQIGQVAPLPAALPYPNRSGRGPLDLWDIDTVAALTQTYGVSNAIGMAVVPKENWIVNAFDFELTSNDGIPTALGSFSLGVLDDTGDVVAWSVPTQVPSVAASELVRRVSVPAAVPSTVLLAGQRYYLVMAGNDPSRLRPLGYTNRSADVALWRRGLLYEWPLASGLNLGSYSVLPLNVASSVQPENGRPAIFVT